MTLKPAQRRGFRLDPSAKPAEQSRAVIVPAINGAEFTNPGASRGLYQYERVAFILVARDHFRLPEAGDYIVADFEVFPDRISQADRLSALVDSSPRMTGSLSKTPTLRSCSRRQASTAWQSNRTFFTGSRSCPRRWSSLSRCDLRHGLVKRVVGAVKPSA